MKNGILLPAYIMGVNALKDKSVKIVLETQELDPEKAGELFAANGKLIFAYLSLQDIPAEEKEIIDSLEPELPGKTPSQRLRNIIFLLWKQDPKGYKDKNLHYLHMMDQICEFYKAKLKD
jgi:hypothetical protein